MDVADFDFELPEELIAQEPAVERGQSRLLRLHRDSGVVEHAAFSAIATHLRAGDLLVLNNTRVFPARLLGRRVPSGGAVECLLLARTTSGVQPDSAGGSANVPLLTSPGSTGGPEAPPPPGPPETTNAPEEWDALMHPGQKLQPGARVVFERDEVRLHGEVLSRHFHGRRTIRLWTEGGGDVAAAIDRIGHIPLPPYIKRDDRPSDRDRYQTVYARDRGSVAAPTAGLHFTRELLDDLASRGVERTEITLHVGYGTFKPMRSARVEEHIIDGERFTVSPDAATALTGALREGRRVIAVGTTTVRALESLTVGDAGVVSPASAETRLFIHPGHHFRIVNGLVTNFHLPKSSLLMLVAAFAGREPVLQAYREAVARGYRFYSYGDAMLIL